MTARSYVLGLLLVGYAGFTLTGALLLAGAAAESAGADRVPVFLAVLGILCVASAFVGDRLAIWFTRGWDRLADENGTSWAVVEAERILRAGEAGEKR